MISLEDAVTHAPMNLPGGILRKVNQQFYNSQELQIFFWFSGAAADIAVAPSALPLIDFLWTA